MKMKKQLLACALVLSLGVAAGTLPQGAINPPTAQLTLHVGAFALASSVVKRVEDMFWPRYDRPQPDSAGCMPWTLDVRCTGRPPSPFDRPVFRPFG